MKRSYTITWNERTKMFNVEMLEDGILLGGASISTLNSGNLNSILWDEEWLQGQKSVNA